MSKKGESYPYAGTRRQIRRYKPKMKGVLNTSWDDIEEVEPDEIDLQMLKAIEEDPECHIFTKESEINWDE